MTRLTQRPAVGGIQVFKQLYGGNPANSGNPASGTGSLDNGASTYVGQKFDTADGRELIFVQNGTSAIAAGKVVAASAEVTAFENLAMTVPTSYPATAGSTQIYVTNGATVLNVNQFQGGFVVVSSGTGAGQTLQIESHQAAAASAKFVVTLSSNDPIQTTLDATSTITLVANPYINVVVSPTSIASSPVGVTLYALTASTAPTYDGTSGALTANGVSQYGLIVKSGVTGCLIDNTVTNVGYPLGPSAATAGALGVATLTTKPQIAISGQTQASGQYGPVYLQL